MLQRPVGLRDVVQTVPPLRRARPRLDQLQDLALDLRVHRLRSRTPIAARPQQADQAVHELATRDLQHEVAAAVLHAGVGEDERGDLDVGVLVADALLQASHRLFGRHCLGADGVADFEVERDVFEGGGGRPLDLSIELCRA